MVVILCGILCVCVCVCVGVCRCDLHICLVYLKATSIGGYKSLQFLHANINRVLILAFFLSFCAIVILVIFS